METSPVPSAGVVAAEAQPPARRCQNCGEPLYGEHCHACGQPTKGLVRHFSSILGDFADTVFNVDGRIFRTLGPLLFKPGHLSLEYFAGRRVRYVSPVRLFVFTCLFAFLLTRCTVDSDLGEINSGGGIAGAATVEEVIALRDAALAGIDRGSAEGREVPGLAEGLEQARRAVQDAADKRIAELESGDAEAAAQLSVRAEPRINFGSEAWHPTDNPLHLAWLPEAGNRQLNAWVARGVDNLKQLTDSREARRRLGEAVMDALPQVLFVLVPIFALLLKPAYLFKRRLYMEHLVVALHSHAFLSLAILILAANTLARQALGEGLLHAALGWVETALLVWMPLYLLLMQKRVYGQGWILTLLKYCVLGTIYMILLSLGIVIALLVSVVVM